MGRNKRGRHAWVSGRTTVEAWAMGFLPAIYPIATLSGNTAALGLDGMSMEDKSRGPRSSTAYSHRTSPRLPYSNGKPPHRDSGHVAESREAISRTRALCTLFMMLGLQPLELARTE